MRLLETLESRSWNTGCKFTLAETGSRNVVRRSVESSHERSCVGYNEVKDSLVVFHGEVTTILSTTAGALTHGGPWVVM